MFRSSNVVVRLYLASFYTNDYWIPMKNSTYSNYELQLKYAVIYQVLHPIYCIYEMNNNTFILMTIYLNKTYFGN